MSAFIFNRLFTCFLFIAMPFFLKGEVTVEPQKVSIVFRMDDPSSTSDWEAETRVVEMFREAGVPISLAVVPFSNGQEITGKRASDLQGWVAEGTVEVALHGYGHKDHQLYEFPSEFAGAPEEQQREMIHQGKESLESITGKKVTIFIPPWNQYDKTTLKVLEELEFQYLSASFEGDFLEEGKLRFLPYTTLLNEYYESVSAARELAKQGIRVSIVVLIHAYEFTDRLPKLALYGAKETFSYEKLKELIAWTVEQPDLEIQTIEEASLGLPESASDSYASQHQLHFDYLERFRPLFEMRNRIMPVSTYTPPKRDYLGLSLTYPMGYKETLKTEPSSLVLSIYTLALPFLVYLSFCMATYYGMGCLLKNREGIQSLTILLLLFLLLFLFLLQVETLGYKWLGLISCGLGVTSAICRSLFRGRRVGNE